jgi:hypothetical protein
MPRAKLAKVSVEELKKEIVRRQRALPKLIASRDALDKKIAELQGLGEPQAAPKRGRRKLAKKRVKRAKRASRPGSLSSKLVEVFQGKKSLPLGDAIQAVLAAGYKTKSKNFATIVGNTLAQDKRFRRVRKGVYALKG